MNNLQKTFADHFNAYNEARRLMSEKGIQSLPVDPFKLAKQMEVDVITYTEAEELFPEKIPKLRSKKIDAIVFKPDYSIEEYYILYDDSRPSERIRFTIAHEIGHIRIGHMTQSDNQLNRYSYNKVNDPIEQEAESFAGELLRPPLLLTLLKIEKPNEIQAICRVSLPAASVGSRSIKKLRDQPCKSHDRLINFYKKQFHKFIHQKQCVACQHTIVNLNAKYCSVCGSDQIAWGEGNMIYKEIELDSQSKAITCPICANEQIIADGNYCHICGIHLVNKCMGTIVDYEYKQPVYVNPCENGLLLGNARHCHYCGGISSYYHHKILKAWDKVEEQKKQLASSKIFSLNHKKSF